MNNNDQFKDLFERYLSGQCTAEELNLLLEHFRVSGSKETSVRSLVLKGLDKDVSKEEENSPAVQEAVNEVHFRIRTAIQQEKKGRTNQIFSWMRTAAVWIILSGALGLLIYYWSAQPETVPMKQLVTQKGERAKITLSDGTKIWLSPSSRLDYPQYFSGNRTVKLTGEAFFDVSPDKMHPFIIQSGGLSTKVLGTSFNIKSYQENELASVTVVTGKVNVSIAHSDDKNAGGVQLHSNQRAVFHKSRQVLHKEDYPDASMLLHEREGRFVFEGVPVAEVLAEVERQYNIAIKTKGDISKCKFYGELNANESAALFLKKLCLAIHAEWHADNGLYILEAKGC